MPLEKYRAKRNFSATPEPRGRVARRGAHALTYVIQKHAASHLHYDFRLELNGTLLSWAIPKGPSLDPADKRLAMHVEDHPIEYGAFEGVIPARQYGAGTVMLWDRGNWQPIGDPDAGYRKGHLKFVLHGEKLRGGWALIRTRGSKYGNGGKEAWLLIKEKDRDARSGAPSILESAPDSVASGRSLNDIAAARERVWESKRSVRENVAAGAIDRRSSRAARGASPAQRPAGGKVKRAGKAVALPVGARRAPFAKAVSPMLTTLVKTAPTGEDWVHEIKYDGYRMVSRVERATARIYSRNGREWTHVFKSVATDLGKLPVKSAWVDGEVVVLDHEGRSSFQALQNALATPNARFACFLFDLIYLDGYDLRQVPLGERKQVLRGLIGDGVGAVRVGPEVEGHGAEFFRQACSLSLEGAVCKRVGSRYLEGKRTRDWVKVKCGRRQEMVIGGYTEPQGARAGFGALLLGVYDQGKLRYSGKVGTGFDASTLAALYRLLRQRERASPAFVDPPRGYAAKGAHWVKPDLVAEIAFTEWSRDGALRHPSFEGLRADKRATDVVREEPLAAPTSARRSDDEGADGKGADGKGADGKGADGKGADGEGADAGRKSAARPRRSGRRKNPMDHDNVAVVADVSLSNPDKLYFPDIGLSKADLARYYERIAPRMLPHVAGRPLALVRCPDGWKGQCFYQKHADRAVHAAVERIVVPEGDGTATYLGASSAAALVGLVQWGVLELHPWGSRKPRLERPDRLIFDLDPDEKLPWKELVTGVELLHALLDELELQGFLKTTGGKGLHVVVPIRASLTWDQAKGFTRGVATFMARTFPDRFTATMSKARRRGKIFIDYLRNSEGATAIAPYAVRARAGAAVSMPIAWNELRRDVRFDHFNVHNAVQRASGSPDPWRALGDTRQAITKAQGRRVGYEL